MNLVYVIHTNDEQLTPAKLKEIHRQRWPSQRLEPRFTRRAYFRKQDANLMLKRLNEWYGTEHNFHLVEYVEK